jgi:hypothetical protein
MNFKFLWVKQEMPGKEELKSYAIFSTVLDPHDSAAVFSESILPIRQ